MEEKLKKEIDICKVIMSSYYGTLELTNELKNAIEKYPGKEIFAQFFYGFEEIDGVRLYYIETESDEDYAKRMKQIEDKKKQDEKYIREQEYQNYLKLKQKFEQNNTN